MRNDDGEEALHGVWRKIGLEGSRTLRRYFTEKATAPYFHKLLKDVFQTPEEVKEKEKEAETRKSQDKVCIVMHIHGTQVGKWTKDCHPVPSNLKISRAKQREWLRRFVLPLLVQYNHYNALSGDEDSQKGNMHFHRNVKGKSSIYSNINRIRVITYHDELKTYHAKEYAGFHQHLYHLTDRAISQCSPDSDWLLVTNGDNTYHRDFLNHLDRSYDLIAYDFYSRWFLHLKKPLPPYDRLTSWIKMDLSVQQRHSNEVHYPVDLLEYVLTMLENGGDVCAQHVKAFFIFACYRRLLLEALHEVFHSLYFEDYYGLLFLILPATVWKLALSTIELKSVTAGQLTPDRAPIQAGSLWAERPALVYVVRRPGCVLCREDAQELTSRIKAGQYDNDINVVGVIQEYANDGSQALKAQIEEGMGRQEALLKDIAQLNDAFLKSTENDPAALTKSSKAWCNLLSSILDFIRTFPLD
eukprot:gene5622-6196_t